MVTYIKRNISKIYVKFDEELSPENFNVGDSYADFLDNKWVLLSEEQVEFHNEHPDASVREVLNMELVPVPEPQEYVRTLEDAKREKLYEIDRYDTSEEVNSFTINNTISAWFSSEERSGYKNSIDSAKILGVKELSLFVGDKLITVSVEEAEFMLASIQLYADSCFMVTKRHQIEIESLESIEEVDEYDYKVGYPEKLNFNTE